MIRCRGPRPVGLATAILAAVAACAPARTLPSPEATSFHRPAALEVFATGYGSIRDKYIRPVSVAAVAVEGLKGLTTIDPDLTVSRMGSRVLLTAHGEAVTSEPVPGDNDVDGWAALTAQLSIAGHQTSEPLRDAGVERLYEVVFDSAISGLDAFSRYAGAKEAQRHRAKRDGYGGIGIRFALSEGVIRVTDVMPDTPAARADMRKDDRITHVGEVPIEGLIVADVIRQLRGPVQSRVTVTLRREGSDEPLVVSLRRAHIIPATVSLSHDDGIIKARISSFNQDTARSLATAFQAASEEMGGRLKGAVIDVRGNPGGLLKQSIKVADLFLTQGDILSTRGRHPDSVQHYSAGGRDILRGLPLVVLVDGKSASAAEIVAAALQDRHRAVVIGTSSFGKGTVQTVIRLPNEGELTLTWSRLIMPGGYALHRLGVHPAICTSGTKTNDPDLVARTLDNREHFAASRAAWRTVGLDDEAQRQLLRSACPAERRRADVENELASRLLNDGRLYARVLDLSSATAELRY